MTLADYDIQEVSRGMHHMTFRLTPKKATFYFWLGAEAEGL